MERVEGPSLLAAMMTGVTVAEGARVLARLHDDMHALAWPDEKTLLHMDLHPLNVLMSPTGPVVIDWSNAIHGPAGLDVAMAAVILAQHAVTLELLALLPPEGRDGPRELLVTFARAVGTPCAEHLAQAAQLRRQDRHQSAAELARIDEAVALAQTLHP
jgi:aminoglycoside phosphotransferase (APT) family kinase protein